MSDEEILEFFTEALTTNFEEVKFLLETTALLSMSDAGGQPEFMDIVTRSCAGQDQLSTSFSASSHNLFRASYLSSSGDSTNSVMSAYGERNHFSSSFCHCFSRYNQLRRVTKCKPPHHEVHHLKSAPHHLVSAPHHLVSGMYHLVSAPHHLVSALHHLVSALHHLVSALCLQLSAAIHPLSIPRYWVSAMQRKIRVTD